MISALRQYQFDGVERVERNAARRILLVSPTGSGKTRMGVELVQRAHARGQRALWVTPRDELLLDACNKLDEISAFEYGIIKAGQRSNLYCPIQVASFDTLTSRVLRTKRLELPPADLILIDEAHLSITQYKQTLLALYDKAKIVGMTATPATMNGRGMRVGYDELIEVATPRELLEQGYLVPPMFWVPSRPDLRRVRVTMGEYEQAGVEHAMEPLLGDIVEHWMMHASHCMTAVFASGITQSAWLAERFRQEGVTAEHCDAKTDPAVRRDIFARFRSGETRVFCNVGLAEYGVDFPELSCIIMARPTMSLTKYLQWLGRGARPFKGKTHFRVHDHAGNFYQHGRMEDERYWSLDGHAKLEPYQRKKKSKAITVPKALTCPECKFLYCGSLTCPQCGHYYERAGKAFKVVDGELVPIYDEEKDSEIEKVHFFLQLLGYAYEKEYKSGWEYHAYREKYHEDPKPEWSKYRPEEPTDQVRRFVKHLLIRNSRRRKAKRERPQMELIES